MLDCSDRCVNERLGVSGRTGAVQSGRPWSAQSHQLVFSLVAYQKLNNLCRTFTPVLFEIVLSQRTASFQKFIRTRHRQQHHFNLPSVVNITRIKHTGVPAHRQRVLIHQRIALFQGAHIVVQRVNRQLGQLESVAALGLFELLGLSFCVFEWVT
ncbi:hypothetical protein BpHYR1_008706 [Brachionus plicatilis]|uniref:Uncharacterized protein n=1 Tax=Brachionus plicatilis TaxID=10195 RepID=A0A3M7TAH8_BRAPC|nr:hypothetical protein BpHYR1_008706 [Brachionus plicatilis]